MVFRDPREAARARVEALERELEAARVALARLEGDREAPPAPARWSTLRRLWRRVPFGAVVLLYVAAVCGGPALCVSIVNHRAPLRWRGTLREPGDTGLRAGAKCRLQVVVNVQGGEVLVGPWQVELRCGSKNVYQVAEACCLDEAAEPCHLTQTRQGSAAAYTMLCASAPLRIDTAARHLDLRRPGRPAIAVDLEPASAPLPPPLFERDGTVIGFEDYAQTD